MIGKSKVKSIIQKVNGLNFYCEIRGRGPTIALVPSGEGDCGSFAKVADVLADEFTVFTLDMRGMSRSERRTDLEPMTARDLASDVAGLIGALNLTPASVYGCSSGGQAVLSIGVYYPEVARNLMVHEAAIFEDPSSLKIMGEQLAKLIKMRHSKNDALLDFIRPLAGDEEAWGALGPEYWERIRNNGDVFFDLVFPSAVERVYTAEELVAMPPLVFSIGLISLRQGPNPAIQANLNAAKKGNIEMVKLPGSHYPQITHPDSLIEHIRKQTIKHLQNGR